MKNVSSLSALGLDYTLSEFDQGIRLRIDSVKTGYDRLERLSPVIKVVIRLHPSVAELARS